MYWALFLLFRFVLRRDVGSVGMSDFLFVILVGDAAQNAMLGEHFGVADGALVIATLAAWNVAIDVLTYDSPGFERVMSPRRLVLCTKGNSCAARSSPTKRCARNGTKTIFLEGNGEIAVIADDSHS